MNLDCNSNVNAIKVNSKFDGKYSNRGERNGLGRREKWPPQKREEGERTHKNRETGEPALKGRRENVFKKT